MTAWGYIVLGSMSTLVGAVVLAFTAANTIDQGSSPVVLTVIGLLLLVAGGVVTAIGVIAEGVRIGNRDSD